MIAALGGRQTNGVKVLGHAPQPTRLTPGAFVRAARCSSLGQRSPRLQLKGRAPAPRHAQAAHNFRCVLWSYVLLAAQHGSRWRQVALPEAGRYSRHFACLRGPILGLAGSPKGRVVAGSAPPRVACACAVRAIPSRGRLWGAGGKGGGGGEGLRAPDAEGGLPMHRRHARRAKGAGAAAAWSARDLGRQSAWAHARPTTRGDLHPACET